MRALVVALCFVTAVTGFSSLELSVASRPAAAYSRASQPTATYAGRRAVMDGAAALLVLGALPEIATASGGGEAGGWNSCLACTHRAHLGALA